MCVLPAVVYRVAAAAAASCVTSDVVIYWLVPGFNSDGKQKQGRTHRWSHISNGKSCQGHLSNNTAQNMCVCVCAGVCVCECFQAKKGGFSGHRDDDSRLYFRSFKADKLTADMKKKNVFILGVKYLLYY